MFISYVISGSWQAVSFNLITLLSVHWSKSKQVFYLEACVCCRKWAHRDGNMIEVKMVIFWL